MLFNTFLLQRLSVLEKATRGYGNSVPERALFVALTQDGDMPVDEFLVLIQWGQLTGLIRERNTETGRRYVLDRQALGAMRAQANGETKRKVIRLPKINQGDVKS
jgi:hypothetical protein